MAPVTRASLSPTNTFTSLRIPNSGKIDARLDGKARARDDFPVVARLEPVHIRAVAVNFLPDAVAGAMHEIFSVAGFANALARHPIHFPAVNRAPVRHCFAYELDGAVSRVSHDAKNFRVRIRHALAEIARPR